MQRYLSVGIVGSVGAGRIDRQGPGRTRWRRGAGTADRARIVAEAALGAVLLGRVEEAEIELAPGVEGYLGGERGVGPGSAASQATAARAAAQGLAVYREDVHCQGNSVTGPLPFDTLSLLMILRFEFPLTNTALYLSLSLYL